MIKVGFTGTRKGMTAAQEIVVANLLKEYHSEGAEFHHGDCKGADDAACTAAMDIGYRTVAHPCDILKMRAFTWSDIILPEKPPLERNKDIVDVSDIMFAAPNGKEEELRSGTWATVRYTRKKNLIHILIFPDGSTKKVTPHFSM